MNPVSLLIVGAGSRGQTYAGYALKFPNEANVVGVAEPNDFRRELVRTQHEIPAKNVATDWAGLARRRRFADAVVISTQDQMHAGPAVAFARKGYHVLLEKPMATTPAECRRIVRTVLAKDVMFAVGHVLRYTSYTRKLKELLDSGAIGDVVCVQHIEPVGYWHQAHSFVRGKWANSADATFMLMAKSCHDIDWMSHVVGRPCRSVQSFGSLAHFRAEHKPAGAGDRCLDCPVEPTCCYSAKKIYLALLATNQRPWYLADLVDGPLTEESVTAALRTGPWGRCVYGGCNNDAVDHQTVNLLYEGGATATFTMTAFTLHRERRTRIFGTRGEISGDSHVLKVGDFLTDKTTTIDTRTEDAAAASGHGGGDYGLMQAFVGAIATGDRSKILTGPEDTLATHLTVFAAEKSRLTGKVVSL